MATKDEARAKFRHDLKQIEYVMKAKDYLLLQADFDAYAAACQPSTLEMLEALAKRYGVAYVEHRPAPGIVPTLQLFVRRKDEGFTYWPSTVKDYSRDEAAALLDRGG